MYQNNRLKLIPKPRKYLQGGAVGKQSGKMMKVSTNVYQLQPDSTNDNLQAIGLANGIWFCQPNLLDDPNPTQSVIYIDRSQHLYQNAWELRLDKNGEPILITTGTQPITLGLGVHLTINDIQKINCPYSINPQYLSPRQVQDRWINRYGILNAISEFQQGRV